MSSVSEMFSYSRSVCLSMFDISHLFLGSYLNRLTCLAHTNFFAPFKLNFIYSWFIQVILSHFLFSTEAVTHIEIILKTQSYVNLKFQNIFNKFDIIRCNINDK